jgi:hypothetical protein
MPSLKRDRFDGRRQRRLVAGRDDPDAGSDDVLDAQVYAVDMLLLLVFGQHLPDPRRLA